MVKENKETPNHSNVYLPFGSTPTSFPRVYHPPERKIWTELVGVTVEEAQNKIKEDMPEAQIEVLVIPCHLSQQLRYERVRIIVDSSGKVVLAPEVG